MDKETRYKKALANIIFYQAIGQSKQELQPQLFYEEETTDSWTVEQCRLQYVKDQLQFIDDGNLDDEIEETWNKVFGRKKYKMIGSEWKFAVWVGGVDDYFIDYETAKRHHDYWVDKGHDDVKIEVLSKENSHG